MLDTRPAGWALLAAAYSAARVVTHPLRGHSEWAPGRPNVERTPGGDAGMVERSPMVRLSLAFESLAHANAALDLLRTSGLRFSQVGRVEASADDGTGRVDIEVDPIDRGMIKTLVQGLRGSVLAEVG
jgi:hypothetical protein